MLKRDRPPYYDWTGFYIGGHVGYAAGYSKWSGTEPGAATPSLVGSLDFFKALDGFKGTGSYFSGFQAGYSYMFPSRLVLGLEADVTFPNFIGGTQTISSASIGQASYAEMTQFSGTVRDRIGYAPGHWLVYATGGFGWTYNQFTRTQLAGTPPGGTADPGTVEALFMVPRIGWTAGSGVEVALPSNWTARLEFLYTDFGARSVSFPLGAQRFDSNLVTQSIRLGFNYRIGTDAVDPDFFTKGVSALDMDRFSLHGQTTYLHQYVFPFRAPYRGPNSLDPNQGRETWDVTFYAGVRLWQGAEFWINPEIDQGFGVSSTLGVAGFPSGEAYKVGATVPYTRIPRMFVRQTIDLGGETQKVESGINQFAGSQTANRLVITVGKFAVTDVFDTNKYAHDARSDFMNWSLITTGTFDYAADAWGYTYGAAVEWYQGNWTLRGGVFDLSVIPNSTDLDPRFQQFQWVGEIEHRHDLYGQPGKVAITGFLSRGRMGLRRRYSIGAIDRRACRHRSGPPLHQPGVQPQSRAAGPSDLGFFARAGCERRRRAVRVPISTGQLPQVSRSPEPMGRPDDTLAWQASSTASRASIKPSSMPGVWVSSLAMVSFQITGLKRLLRCITACPFFYGE